MPIEINGADEATVGPLREALKAAAKEQDNTLTGKQTFSARVGFGVVTLTDGANIPWDCANGNMASVTLAGNRALENPTNVAAGSYVLRVIQDGTGTRTLSYGANFKFPGGTAPVLSTAAGSVDVLTFLSFGDGSLYLVSALDFQ
ncbi:hypothetical protein HNR46_001576 [Haloferula luteola]|uniref:Uncharacterized protein n=1 Tax=Haloferula luteola TaxID=595692 RepID=A0A840VBM9_9BACT|nr:hypothetical protein [Haloferula luteola]MBB5351340.1 hypothetical protein [Haloferula luteola]